MRILPDRVRRCRPAPRTTDLLGVAIVVRVLTVTSLLAVMNALAVSSALASDRPRLLIRPADLPRIRHLANEQAAGSAALAAIRSYFADAPQSLALPGELSAAAFQHLAEPTPAQRQRAAQRVEATLADPLSPLTDPLEAVIALDWCWESLSPDARRAFLREARPLLAPLTAADSPLDSPQFRLRLAGLALAISIDERDEPSTAWRGARQRIVQAARGYFVNTFPVYLRWRGLSPTSPAVAAREEYETALALELGSQLLGEDLWARHAQVGRWLEHYLFSTPDPRRFNHHFVRDDGGLAPLLPTSVDFGVLPLGAALLATRTADPAAALVAARVQDWLAASQDARMRLTRWSGLLFDLAPLRRCDLALLPAARNFGGAVFFGSPTREQRSGVWIEAGQPFLRRRQHLDAGHFLVHSHGGRLVVAETDDIVNEAVPTKGGLQRLGTDATAFDFEQFLVSSIAHNCLIVSDAARAENWHGRPYACPGGQRLIDGTCVDFGVSLELSGRETGRQLAYGLRPRVAYLALDLAPAYDARALTRYTRQFIFLDERVLLIVDRFALAHPRVAPTFILNIPAAPTVDDTPLSTLARTAGADHHAGVWPVQGQWVRWGESAGVAQMRVLLPQAPRISIVGGSATRERVTAGTFAGREYIGGAAESFERLVVPSSRSRPRNAWYRLGRPTLLGEQVGAYPRWGRIEIEPTQKADEHVIAVVLVFSARAGDAAAAIRTESEAGVLRVIVDDAKPTLSVTIRTAGDLGGSIEADGGPIPLPTTVEPDAPLTLQPDR